MNYQLLSLPVTSIYIKADIDINLSVHDVSHVAKNYCREWILLMKIDR